MKICLARLWLFPPALLVITGLFAVCGTGKSASGKQATKLTMYAVPDGSRAMSEWFYKDYLPSLASASAVRDLMIKAPAKNSLTAVFNHR